MRVHSWSAYDESQLEAIDLKSTSGTSCAFCSSCSALAGSAPFTFVSPELTTCEW